MEFDLKRALKKHNRRRALRNAYIGLAIPAGIGVPQLFDFGRTDTLICIVGALVVSLVGHLEVRLKVVQVRLATMADDLVALRGKEPEGNLLLELSDW